MARDTRLWARFTLDFADNPKIVGLSDAAFRVLVEMILYSRQHLTDGVLSAGIVERRWKTQSVSESVTQSQTDPVTELLTNDTENPSLSRNGNGDYVIHGFLDHQESRADVNARKARNLANGKRGGRPKKTQSVNESVSQSVSESVTQSGTQTETRVQSTEIDSPNGLSDSYVRTPETDTETQSVTESVSRKRSTPKRQATRLPEGWQPSPEAIEWAQREHPHVDLHEETERFVDHWAAESGAKARKVDWTAAWRNWIRNSERYQAERRGYRNQAQMHQDMVNQAAAATQQMQQAGLFAPNPLALIEGSAQ